MNTDLPHRPILTISRLTALIKTSLESEFQDLWVEGEISNFRAPNSGHFYLTLKDAEAQIRAVFFRASIRSLKFAPKDGLQVICRGRVTVYEPRGEYQIVIDYMEPKGVGALQLAFEQLKDKLLKEGLFDEGRKRPIPPIPRRIGIVTSPTGAALQDILKVIRRRFANVDLLVAPAAVQGDKAVPEILEGIRDLNARGDVDVIILARGGGGIEDLWAFNDEAVARAVYHSRLPVISAVGHEIDFTIADFTADLRAPTPSAAAEMVIRNKEELLRHLENLASRMTAGVTSALDLWRTRLAALRRLLPKPVADLQRNFQRLDDLDFRLRQGWVRFLGDERGRLEGLAKHILLAGPTYRLAEQRQRLDSWEESLRRTMIHALRIQRATMQGLISRLNALSPLAILSRGYSVVRKVPSQAIIRSHREVGWGDRIRVTLGEGELICRVEKTEGS